MDLLSPPARYRLQVALTRTRGSPVPNCQAQRLRGRRLRGSSCRLPKGWQLVDLRNSDLVVRRRLSPSRTVGESARSVLTSRHVVSGVADGSRGFDVTDLATSSAVSATSDPATMAFLYLRRPPFFMSSGQHRGSCGFESASRSSDSDSTATFSSSRFRPTQVCYPWAGTRVTVRASQTLFTRRQ